MRKGMLELTTLAMLALANVKSSHRKSHVLVTGEADEDDKWLFMFGDSAIRMEWAAVQKNLEGCVSIMEGMVQDA